jgi:ABC-type sugar transport system ATPase subunit
MPEDILSMKSVCKFFPGVRALDNVDFACTRGEVHGLVGHNGAGKSTLIKILGGVYIPDKGDLYLRGKRFVPSNPVDATSAGISIIHQEFNLIPDLTVAQNIFLAREPGGRVFLDRQAMIDMSQRVLEQLGIKDIDPTDPVRDLSVNQLQLVEIAKALSVNAEIIVMDEPTAALPLPDIQNLFDIIRGLRARNVTIIYISHRLEEIFQIADRVTVMKDGRMVGTFPTDGLERTRLIESMVGRSILDFFPQHAKMGSNQEPVFVVRDFSCSNRVSRVSFEIHRGEIFGITGLEGSGGTELVRGLFGVDKRESGEILLHGQKVEVHSPEDALRAGFGFVTKDRRNEGLILGLSLAENMAIPMRVRERKLGLLNIKRESDQVTEMSNRLVIRASDLSVEARYLSGGNQQKVILAKWLMTGCRVIIFDEPTRGIDVESKAEIYKLMRELVKQGVVVIVVSSDIEEILGLCDKILVLHRGETKGRLNWTGATEEAVMLAATGCLLNEDGEPESTDTTRQYENRLGQQCHDS